MNNQQQPVARISKAKELLELFGITPSEQAVKRMLRAVEEVYPRIDRAITQHRPVMVDDQDGNIIWAQHAVQGNRTVYHVTWTPPCEGTQGYCSCSCVDFASQVHRSQVDFHQDPRRDIYPRLPNCKHVLAVRGWWWRVHDQLGAYKMPA
ncbi:MAG: hypothetical protein CL489_07960 [Acidobacteria bacterium]|nr:hypothetical protein [Acidobacteriota bacterium]